MIQRAIRSGNLADLPVKQILDPDGFVVGFLHPLFRLYSVRSSSLHFLPFVDAFVDADRLGQPNLHVTPISAA